MAAMGGGMGMRTIWIALRATNYTSRIFQEVIKDLVRLEVVEKKVGQAMAARLRMGQAMIMTGMMMTTMGMMMTQGLLNMAMATEKGAAEMGQLTEEIERAKVVFADAIYDILKLTGVLDVLHSILGAMEKNRYIAMIAAGLILFAGAALMVGGAIIFLAGVMNSWTVVSKLVPSMLAKINVALLNHGIVVHGTAIAWWQLAMAVGAGVGLFLVLRDVLGPIPAALFSVALAVGVLAVQLWLAAGAMSVLTWGMAAIAGAAALAGAIAVATGATGKQFGTRGLGQTGFVYAHKGEVIYNPATRRPTQVANELEGGAIGRRGATTIYETPVTIENAHLKADFDDLDEEFTRVQRKRIRRSR